MRGSYVVCAFLGQSLLALNSVVAAYVQLGFRLSRSCPCWIVTCVVCSKQSHYVWVIPFSL